jgi:phosphonate transport system substrate-binding protein
MKWINFLRSALLRQLLQRLLISVCLSVALAIVCAHVLAKSCERPAQLRFSVIPQGGMQQDIASLQPLLDALGDALNIPVIAMESHSYGAVTEGLLSGAVDLARLGPASYVAAKLADPRITAFASYARSADIFNQESAAYYSLLVVNAASRYASLQSLRGRKVALVDPDSTSGAVLPRHMVKQEMHRDLEQHFGQVIYTGSHHNSIQSLLRNEVSAAFVSSSHLSDLVESGKTRLNAIRILWRSSLIPRDPFVYRGQLCGDIKQKIAGVFLKHDGQHFKSLLKNLNATRFVPVNDKDFHIVRSIHTME